MCSGVALPMIAVVGVAALVRRGWKAAAFQVLPLAALHTVWRLATSPGGIDNPYGRNPERSRRSSASSGQGCAGPLARVGGVRRDRSVPRSRRSSSARGSPGMTAVHTLRLVARRPRCSEEHWSFSSGTGITPGGSSPPTADSQSRYIYILAALLLPGLGVAVDAVVGAFGRVLIPGRARRAAGRHGAERN